VRQACAIVLAVLFSFSLISPALFADSPSNLPSCCRREGKHHCAMISMAAAPSGPAVGATHQKCPYFPKPGSGPTYSKTVLVNAALTIFASISSHPAVQPQTEARYRTSFSRSRQKRGPPVLLS
jgi:hypothetical protein